MASARGDFVAIPHSDGDCAIFSGDDIVDRPVELPRFDVGVFGGFIVQDLYFHALVSGVSRKGRANPDTVVRTLFEFEFELKDEIAKLFFGEKISAAPFGAIQDAVSDTVARALPVHQGPAIERFTIEQRDKIRAKRITLAG